MSGGIVLASLQDELLVLITVAKSDNRMIRNERDIIVRYAEERAKDKRLPFTADDASAIHSWIKKQDPTTSHMRAAIERIANTDRSGLQALLEVTEIVAEMDGKLKPDEARGLAEAQSVIRSMMQTQSRL